MTAQSFLAKHGMRSGVLGSNGDLAVAAPLAAGDPDPAAHTDANRIGWWYDRTGASEGVVVTVMGSDRFKADPEGIDVGNATDETPTIDIVGKTSGGVGESITSRINFAGDGGLTANFIQVFKDFGVGTAAVMQMTAASDLHLNDGAGNVIRGVSSGTPLHTLGRATITINVPGRPNFQSYWDQAGIAAPAVSASGTGRIYFDSTSNTFQVSEDGGAYVALVGGGGGGTLVLSGTGTDNLVTSSVGAFSSAVAGMDNNIAIGRDALNAANNASADSNIAIGTNALGALTTGNGCLAIGQLALSTMTTQQNNVAVGRSAGSGHTGSDGTFIGRSAAGGTGSGVTAIGQNAQATGNVSTAIGSNALAGTGFSTVAIGVGAQATSNNCTAIGRSANATADGSTAIGSGTNATHADTICIGSSSSSTAINQCVMGSNSSHFSNMYVGGGVTNTTAGNNFTLHTSGANGTDRRGWHFSIAPGQGTGSAHGGYFQLRFAPGGTTGTSLNALRDGLRILGAAAPAAFTASSDVDGMDVYIRGQNGGTHSANNPRGADLLFVPGAAGSGGTGREGRVVIQGNFKTDQGHILAGIQTVVGAGGSPDATADGTDTNFYLDGGANTVTLALDAAPVTGQLYYVKSIDSSNTATVDGNGNNIDGSGSLTLATDESLTVHWDGTEWRVL